MLQRGFTPESISKALVPKKEAVASRPQWFNWETGVQLVKFGTQIGLAYYRRQQHWVELEGRVLAAARDHEGWLSEAQFLAALNFRARDASIVGERLCKQGLCRILAGKHGSNVYIFDSLLPPVLICDYCDQPRPAGHHISCTQCGAP